MFCGFVAGTSEALLAVTPMETLKTRVADDQRQGTKNYKGSVDALVKILKKDGPMGVYRGPIPTVLKQGTNQMVRFPFQQFFLGLLAGDDAAKKKNPLYSGLAGAFAGAASVIVTMPQDTVKTRMQSEGGNLKYKGTLDCLKQIVNQHGIGFLWSGTMPRLVRVSLDVGITFTIMPYLTSILGK
jgi:solute carrier family 25 citrate transporter 1